MMAATVMNALSDVLDAKRQLEKGSLSEHLGRTRLQSHAFFTKASGSKFSGFRVL